MKNTKTLLLLTIASFSMNCFAMTGRNAQKLALNIGGIIAGNAAVNIAYATGQEKELYKKIEELLIKKADLIRKQQNCIYDDLRDVYSDLEELYQQKIYSVSNYSHPNEYWKNELECLKIEKQCILNHIFYWNCLREVDKNDLISLYTSIPLFMECIGKQTLAHSTYQIYNNQKIDAVTTPINSGYYHNAFQVIMEQNPELKKLQLSLCYDDTHTNHYAYAQKSYVVLCSPYDHTPDGFKLFILFHELTHLLFNDFAIFDNNITSKILNQHPNQTLAKDVSFMLCMSSPFFDNIHRYQEWRADTHAVQSMQCPHCVQEASMGHSNYSAGYYNPAGYFYRWQFQPRIDELLAQGTICQHHHNNGGKIDLSICNGWTLTNRLKILKKS